VIRISNQVIHSRTEIGISLAIRKEGLCAPSVGSKVRPVCGTIRPGYNTFGAVRLGSIYINITSIYRLQLPAPGKRLSLWNIRGNVIGYILRPTIRRRAGECLSPPCISILLQEIEPDG